MYNEFSDEILNYITDKLRDRFKYNSDFENILISNQYPDQERVIQGIIIQNTTGDLMKFAPDDYIGNFSSFVSIGYTDKYPGTFLDWASPDFKNIYKPYTEDVSLAITEVTDLIQTSKFPIVGNKLYDLVQKDITILINNVQASFVRVLPEEGKIYTIEKMKPGDIVTVKYNYLNLEKQGYHILELEDKNIYFTSYYGIEKYPLFNRVFGTYIYLPVKPKTIQVKIDGNILPADYYIYTSGKGEIKFLKRPDTEGIIHIYNMDTNIIINNWYYYNYKTENLTKCASGIDKLYFLSFSPEEKTEQVYFDTLLLATSMYKIQGNKITFKNYVPKSVKVDIDYYYRVYDNNITTVANVFNRESLIQLPDTDLFDQMFEVYVNTARQDPATFEVDYPNGILKLKTLPTRGTTYEVCYRIMGISGGPFPIEKKMIYNNILKGVNLAVGDQVNHFDKIIILTSNVPKSCEDEWGGKNEMNISFSCIAGDPRTAKRLGDIVRNYIWGDVKPYIENIGMDITNCNMGGNSEEELISAIGELDYRITYDITVLTDWAKRLPRFTRLMDFDMDISQTVI